jgi:hypothetical protein
MLFFVYLDWTLEPISRCFYVGKGLVERIHKRERNYDWKVIADKFGLRREVVYASFDEDAAYDAEKWLVAYHDTFRGWGANLNDGGRGQKSGWKHTRASKSKISRAQMGHASWSRGTKHPTAGPKISVKLRGLKRSEETKERQRRAALLRPPISDVTRQKMRQAKLGGSLSKEHKLNIGLSLKGRDMSQETRTLLLINQPQRRVVRQIDTECRVIAIFDSIQEAVRQTGIVNVGQCCRGIRKTAGGFSWSFVEIGEQNV